jgi:hypothetical protein
MAVQVFSIEDFIDALPVDKDRVYRWQNIGLIDGEYCFVYQMPNPNVRLLIRSSIKSDGKSAETGKDSIRIIIQRKFTHTFNDKPVKQSSGVWYGISKGFDAYTQRTVGWEIRLKEKLKELAKKASRITCEFDDHDRVYFASKGKPENLGRPLAFRDGKFNRWLDTNKTYSLKDKTTAICINCDEPLAECSCHKRG